jgi:hypothetical protein
MYSQAGLFSASDFSGLPTRAEAERELARGPRCRCCVHARVHLTRYIGSTLFFDDNPEQLQLALPAADRERFTPRLIAACIVLFGRARVELHERS